MEARKKTLAWTFVAALLGLVALVPALLQGQDTGRNQRVDNRGASPGYQVSATTTAYRTGLDGGEAFTELVNSPSSSTFAGVNSLSTAGYQTVSVTGHHSASGATCVITLVRCHFNSATSVLTVKSIEDTTLTADTTYTRSAQFPSAASVPFDTQGANLCKVLAQDPSTGTIDLWVEVH